MPIFLSSQPVDRQINDIIRYQEQKKIYEEQNKAREISAPIYTQVEKIPLQKSNISSACIHIKKIDTQQITLIDRKKLDQLIIDKTVSSSLWYYGRYKYPSKKN